MSLPRSCFTEIEIKFIADNYKYYTPSRLAAALNNLRQKIGEKICSTYAVSAVIKRLKGGESDTNEGSSKENSLQTQPPVRVPIPKKQPEHNKKTQALKDYQKESELDDMCESLSRLMNVPDEEDDKI